MKKNILVLLLLSFCPFNGVSAEDQVSCEKIENRTWGSTWGTFKTCFMDETTQINSADTTIASRDESVHGLWLNRNTKIKFLPVGLSEKFPNLLGLTAGYCSLTISKANFKGLSKLRGLFLHDNQIEKITSDVFNGLVALEQLSLYNNKLKFINGKAFARLTKLILVDLRSNQCINEDFKTPARIAVLQQTVNEKCSIDEFELDDYVKKTFSIVSSLADKKCEKPQDLATFAITLGGVETKTSSEATTEVISKLNALKTQQKEECGNIVARALEVQAKTLKEQTAEIIDVKVKSEMQTMLKMAEIEKLSEELQRKNEEIIEKNEKIRKLNEKVETLSRNFK